MTAVATGVSFEPCPPEWPPFGELAGVMRYEATDGWCVLTPCRVRPPVEDPEYLTAVVRRCEQQRPAPVRFGDADAG